MNDDKIQYIIIEEGEEKESKKQQALLATLKIELEKNAP